MQPIHFPYSLEQLVFIIIVREVRTYLCCHVHSSSPWAYVHAVCVTINHIPISLYFTHTSVMFVHHHAHHHRTSISAKSTSSLIRIFCFRVYTTTSHVQTAMVRPARMFMFPYADPNDVAFSSCFERTHDHIRRANNRNQNPSSSRPFYFGARITNHLYPFLIMEV